MQKKNLYHISNIENLVAKIRSVKFSFLLSIFWEKKISLFQYIYTPTKQMFSGVYWSRPVCPSICVSICVQNTSFCQSAGGGIKSHLLTAQVSTRKKDYHLSHKFVSSANAFLNSSTVLFD